MNKNLLNVKNLNFSKNNNGNNDAITQITRKDIAIIGMSGRFGSASDYNEFWNSIRSGKDLVREFPESRKKHIDQYYQNKGARDDHQKEYFIGAYLDRIDEFDYGHFSLSPKEADLMDPHQRLFLQTAWNAIEDSGYGGNKLKGTKTGIFVGYSADFGEDYREIIRTNDPGSLELSVVPNLRSIIASRIAYILDLTGPSLVVDTACSSSLMAVHLACKSLQQNECEMAIAGSIRLLLIPTKKDEEFRIGLEKILGVESDSGRARTFDESSDGTGLGEGMGALILKPLNKAIEDKDHIYAVIKGSAANQDGNSIGITAPNSEAQAKVIMKAWEDAGVNPETISYIEAHGTGTNLGDPIEINGLQRAFRKYTDKKQFCGIGSLKTNLGHLDNAAGMVSIFKAVMSLVHREIPPSLSFNYPNRKINFVDSPIYVNDTLRQWEANGHPRRCGISAFGLSGTNCHIILEEAPKSSDIYAPKTTEYGILTMSASSMESLMLLVDDYKRFLKVNPGIDMESLSYTANTGRGHYIYRLAVIYSNQDDLIYKLNMISDPQHIKDQRYIFYKEHRVVTTENLVTSDIEITENFKKSLTLEAERCIEQVTEESGNEYEFLADICKLYVSGATVDWENCYKKQGKKIRKISIPAYPFAKKQCWVKTSDKVKKKYMAYKKEISMPLIDNLKINMNDFSVYETVFIVEKDWVLNEHKILGQYLAPGTTYIEMIREIMHYFYNDTEFQLSGVTFMSPMIVKPGELREVYTILKKKNNYIEFTVSSKPGPGEASVTHAEGKINFASADTKNRIYNLSEIRDRMTEENIKNIIQVENNRSDIEVGGRWDCARRIFSGDNEYLTFMELPDVYEKDLSSFIVHPSLMDCAVNVLNSIISDELYLPFTYKNIRFFEPLPKSFWCYLRRREKGSDETISFDIEFISNDEKPLAEIEEYTIKKVNTLDLQSENANSNRYYQLGWKEVVIEQYSSDLSNGTVLYFMGQNELSDKMSAILRNKGHRVIEVLEGETFLKLNENQYFIDGSEKGYEVLFDNLDENTFGYILQSYAINDTDHNKTFELLNEGMQKSLYSLFNLTRALINRNIKIMGNMILLADYAYVINPGKETPEAIKPVNSAYFGLAEVISNEYSNLKLKCIDVDSSTSADVVFDEIKGQDDFYSICYRNNIRYVKELKQVDLNEYEESHFEVKPDGVYIITGGTGALGLSVGKYLASKNKVTLCLINRSSLPLRDEWDRILNDNNKLSKDGQKLASKISIIREIEKNGSEVCFINADVADPQAIEWAIRSIRSRYGKINGIVHTAGIAGQGFVFNKEEKTFKEVLAPKIQGTWLLHSLTREDNLDFMVLFSSISSFTAEMGQGDYAAANAYMDSFSNYRNSMGYKTIAVNWPAWKEIGMAVEFNVDFENEIFGPVTTKNALQMMEQVLHKKISSIVPAEINYKNLEGLKYKLPFTLSSRIQQNIKKYKTYKNMESAQPVSEYSVIIKGKPEDKITSVERSLAQLWAKILGLNELNINDKFQSLGGDSILATELLKAMEEEFPGMVDIADVFTYSTIASMAGYIEGLQSDNAKLDLPASDKLSMEEIFVKLERGEIGPEEADRLISEL